jgi:hypothetical protein
MSRSACVRQRENAALRTGRRIEINLNICSRLGGACLFVQRPQATRAHINLARQTTLINRGPLNIEPEHPVGPALRVTHIVAEARPSTADVTLTSHRTPLNKDSTQTSVARSCRVHYETVSQPPTNW